MQPEKIPLALVDDHHIFRQALANILAQSKIVDVILEAGHGLQLQEGLLKGRLPALILLDLSMPVMDGFETLAWLSQYYPLIPVIILTERYTNLTLATLIYGGARAVLAKTIDVHELLKAIGRVVEEGHYFTDPATRKIWLSVYKQNNKKLLSDGLFTAKEWRFLQLVGTSMTYEQIGDILRLSKSGIKKLQHQLFNDLDVQNRAELAVLAERHGIAKKAA